MKNKNITVLKKFRRITSTLLVFLTTFHPEIDPKGIIGYLNWVSHSLEHRGLPTTIRDVKLIRLCTTSWIAGCPVPPGFRISARGLPTIVDRYLGGYLDTMEGRKVALTVISCLRTFEGVFPEDVSVIESPFTGDPDYMRYFKKHLPAFTRRKIFKRPQWQEWLFTTRKGPNGPSIHTCYRDILLLTERDIADYRILAGDEYASRLETIKEIIENRPEFLYEDLGWPVAVDTKSKVRDRLSFVPDSEGKTRAISMGTYWCQNALKSLHSEIFKILKRIPQDATFDHSKGFKTLRKPEGHRYWSFDLTSATDRFPRFLQEEILSFLVDKEFSQSWGRVISQPHWYQKGNRWVNYTVGQPMGKLSSWAVFALCHHFVVHVAHRIAKVKIYKGSYVLLGDDIVIANDRVALCYLDLMKILGVEINMAKSHVSFHTFEFAKRWSHKGTEISPFPIGALLQSKSWVTSLVETLRLAMERGWSIPNPRKVLVQLMGIPKGFLNDRYIEHLRRLANISWTTSQADQSNDWSLCFNELVREFSLNLPAFSREDARLLKNSLLFQLWGNAAERSIGVSMDEHMIFSSMVLLLQNQSPNTDVPGLGHFRRNSPHEAIKERWKVAFAEQKSSQDSLLLIGFEPDVVPEGSLTIPTPSTAWAPNRLSRKVIHMNALLKEICQMLKAVDRDETEWLKGLPRFARELLIGIKSRNECSTVLDPLVRTLL